MILAQIYNHKRDISISRSQYIYLFIQYSVKPTAVTILDKISHVSADKEVEVTCQAVGGYPSPKLTWLLGSKLLRPFDEVS